MDDSSGPRVLVRNPNSGDRKRTVQARDLALDYGFDIRDSTARGETRRLARAAVEDGATLVAACGGDGTLNEVVRGVMEANALDTVTIGVVPAGTGNDFADNIGVQSVAQAFELFESGDVRQLDLGVVRASNLNAPDRAPQRGDRPFVNSCVGGLTAEASARTSPAMKRRVGTLAYVLSTLARTRDFEGLSLEVRAGQSRDRVWSGEALMLLIGNGRRFPGERMRQANIEDGLCNVVIIERAPAIDYLARGAADKLLRRGARHLTRIKVPHLNIVHQGDPVTFSLDGEMIERTDLTVDSLPGAMRFVVGTSYDPKPEEWGQPL